MTQRCLVIFQLVSPFLNRYTFASKTEDRSPPPSPPPPAPNLFLVLALHRTRIIRGQNMRTCKSMTMEAGYNLSMQNTCKTLVFICLKFLGCADRNEAILKRWQLPVSPPHAHTQGRSGTYTLTPFYAYVTLCQKGLTDNYLPFSRLYFEAIYPT